MKEKFRARIVGSFPAEDTEFSSSIQATTENLDEVSEKIAAMMPKMGVIKATGIIKQTKSFEESKQILDNFKAAMENSPDGAFEEREEPPKEEEKDDRSALEQATDRLFNVVDLMLKAGIKVPSIYKDFLYSVRPPQIPKREVDIEKSKPLFAITGLDENGNVRLETDTDITIKRGKLAINLKEEKLRKTLEDSQKVDTKNVREMKEWIACKVKEAGSFEAISDNTWNQLRKNMKEKWTVQEEEKPNPDIQAPEYEVLTEGGSVEKPKEVIQSVNKNAYEIRLEILKKAIDLARLQKGPTAVPTEEEIVGVASKLYKFVENKR